MDNKITRRTRKDIFDLIRVENISCHGQLREVDFLDRIFDLKSLRSLDQRYSNAFKDIETHTANFLGDWDEDWYINDERFNLLNCDDTKFGEFICEILHPIVRPNLEEVKSLYSKFNDCLAFDNFKLVALEKKIDNKPVFEVISKNLGGTLQEQSKKDLSDSLGNTKYIEEQISKMGSSITMAPSTAIAIAKELIETTCKTILKEKQIGFNNNWNLNTLLQATTKSLKVTPKDISDEQKASKALKSILGGLTAIVNGMGELRNSHGDGHGKETEYKGLTSRHAKLSVNSCLAITNFLFETHKYHQNKANHKKSFPPPAHR